MTKLDQLGQDVAKEVKSLAAKLKNVATQQSGLDKDRISIQPQLRQVWDALKAGTVVNGCKTTKEWAEKFAKVTPRYCQYILKGNRDRTEEVKRRTSGSPIKVLLTDVQFNSSRAIAFIWIEQVHEVKYQGARRDQMDISYREDNGNVETKEFERLKKEDKVVFTHTVQEVRGELAIKVENDGTLNEKQLNTALFKKMVTTLQSMRLWDGSLSKEFTERVEESISFVATQKERRSDSAKRAAETRKENKQIHQDIKDQVAQSNAECQ